MMVARPKIDVSQPRRTLIVGASAVASAVLVLAVVVGVRAMHRADDTDLMTAARPATLSTLVGADWTAGDVGDCLAQVPDADDLQVVGCAEPHDLQRFAAATVDGDLETMPASVDHRCAEAFENFVGRPDAESELDIAQTRPSAESWQHGDREFQCYLGMEGKRLRGDARATGW